MNDEIKPTEQDVELAAEFKRTHENGTLEEFAAWLRSNYFVDSEHKSWF